MQNKRNLLEIAQTFFKKGLTPIPCHAVVDGACTCEEDCGSPGKHPAITWQRFQKKPIDDAQLDIWFGECSKYADWNIGLITGSISGNIFVVDVDCGDGKDGEESLRQLQMKHDDLPPTMSTKTGGGGRHYFYRAPAGVRVPTNKNVLGAGIDIRGEGGFVVAHGSIHASGNLYVCDLDEIADAPDWLIPLVEENAEHTQHGRGIQAAHTGDNPFKVDDGREGVMIKVIISIICNYYEEHRELPTVEQIIELGYQRYVDMVVSRTGDLDKEHRGIKMYTQRAKYQLSRARNGHLDVLTKLKAEIASRDPRSAPAQVSRAAVQYEDWESPPEQESEEPPPAKEQTTHEDKPFRLLDWKASQFEGDPPDPIWLVENKIPAGVPMLLAAAGGTGKSFISLDLAVKVAGGRADWDEEKLYAFGGRVRTFGKVVFLTAEDGKAAVHRRFSAVCPPDLRERVFENLIAVPLPDAGGAYPWVIQTPNGSVNTPEYVETRRQLLEIDDLALVIVDPLQVFAATDITADPKHAQAWWRIISSLCADTGATVMVTHHMRKDGAFSIKTLTDARQAIRGTTGLVDGARLAYSLWSNGDDEEMELCRLLGLDQVPGNIVMGGVVKSNDFADSKITIYKRERNGLLTDCTQEIEEKQLSASRVTPNQQKLALLEVDNRWSQGQPFGTKARKGLTLQDWLTTTHNVSRQAARQAVDEWTLGKGLLIEKKNAITGLPGLALTEAGLAICQKGERYGD